MSARQPTTFAQSAPPLNHTPPSALLQRACACGQHTPGGGECAGCKKKRLQRSAAGAGPVTAPPIVHDVLGTSGQPLDAATRSFMEPRFGWELSRVPANTPQRSAKLPIGAPGDRFEREAEAAATSALNGAPAAGAFRNFSHIRVHTDAQAAESARAVGARAYTVGNHIVFGAGAYAPQTTAGRHLLAHELAHTVQQGAESCVQRFANCTPARMSLEECPARTAGEAARARSQSMEVGEVSGTAEGILVANFAIGSSAVKRDLHSNSIWLQFVRDIAANPNVRWEILGFTDCHGDDSFNESLRQSRPDAIFAALPTTAQRQIDRRAAAPVSNCITENTTEQDRAWNRSVLFQRTSTNYEFDDERVEANSYVACFDGTTIHVLKNGMSHHCSAVTGTVGAPTPDGVYCIRRQGEAQSAWRPWRDHSDWYLLEPQFSTTRSRMHLHPGSVSAGCITVTDSDCFDQLAAILNSSGTVSGEGYDGYPPGNTEGVTNVRRSITCVGWLLVRNRSGACSFMSGGTATP